MPGSVIYLWTFISVLLAFTSNAQLNINIGVDTTTEQSQIVVDFLDRYFTDFKEDNEVDYNDYFYKQDADSFYYPDKVAFGLIGNTSNYFLGKPTLLSLDIKSDTVLAKVMFAQIDSLKKPTVNFIANYYLTDVQNNCRFLVTQKIETRDWHKTKIRNVTFHYPPYHNFNRHKAQILIDQIIALEKNWGLDRIEIDYYFTKTNKEIQRVKGFDFNFLMARSEYPGGLAYEKERSVFCSGLGESYFHEIVHLYLNPAYPKSPLKEGIATFYGGSLGKSYQKHILRLHDYVRDRPNLNIADHRSFHYMDEQTSPKYSLQAFICHLVHEKKGIKGLKALLTYTSLETIYGEEFGIAPGEGKRILKNPYQKFC